VAFLLFLAIPLLRINYMPAFSFSGFMVHMVLLGAFAVYAAGALRRGNAAGVGITLIDALVFLFYFLYLSSYIFSGNRDVSLAELAGESTFAGVYVLFRVILAEERNGGDFRPAAALCVAVAASVLSVWGLAQYFFEFDVPRGLKLLFRTHHFPVVGSMGNPNFLAEFLAFSAPFTVSFFCSRKRYYLMGAALLLTGLAVYLTYSRLSWFALAAAMVFMVAFAGREARWRIAAAFAVLVAVCGAFFLYHLAGGSTRSERIVQTFAISRTTPLFERTVIYRSATAMLADAGLTGMGQGMFGYRYLEYQGKTIEKDKDRFLRKHLVDLDHAHSDFIEIGVEAGYPAMGAFILLLAYSAFSGVRKLVRDDRDDPLKFVSIVPVLYAIFSMWSFPFYIPASKLFFLFSIAHLAPPGRDPESMNPDRIPARGAANWMDRNIAVPRVSRRWIAVTLLAVLAPVTWVNGRYMLSVYHHDSGLRFFKKDYAAASSHFRRGIKAYRNNGYNHFSLGALMLNHRDPSGIARLEESLKYMNNSTTYLNIARGYREHGKTDEAKKWYRRLLRLRPDIRRAWIEYGQIMDGGPQSRSK
jgi:hypothetical protein